MRVTWGEAWQADVPDDAVPLAVGWGCPACGIGQRVELIDHGTMTYACGPRGANHPQRTHDIPPLCYQLRSNGHTEVYGSMTVTELHRANYIGASTLAAMLDTARWSLFVMQWPLIVYAAIVGRA